MPVSPLGPVTLLQLEAELLGLKRLLLGGTALAAGSPGALSTPAGERYWDADSGGCSLS